MSQVRSLPSRLPLCAGADNPECRWHRIRMVLLVCIILSGEVQTSTPPTLLCRCGRAGYPVAVPALRGPEMFGRSIGLRRGVDRPRTPPKPLNDAQTWGSLVGSAPNGNTSGRQPGIGGFESLPRDFPDTSEVRALFSGWSLRVTY